MTTRATRDLIHRLTPLFHHADLLGVVRLGWDEDPYEYEIECVAASLYRVGGPADAARVIAEVFEYTARFAGRPTWLRPADDVLLLLGERVWAAMQTGLTPPAGPLCIGSTGGYVGGRGGDPALRRERALR